MQIFLVSLIFFFLLKEYLLLGHDCDTTPPCEQWHPRADVNFFLSLSLTRTSLRAFSFGYFQPERKKEKRGVGGKNSEKKRDDGRLGQFNRRRKGKINRIDCKSSAVKRKGKNESEKRDTIFFSCFAFFSSKHIQFVCLLRGKEGVARGQLHSCPLPSF